MTIFKLLVAGALFSATAGVAFAGTTDARALLDRHTAFVGWKSGDAALGAWRSSGARSAGNGLPDSFSEVRRGLVFRDTLSTSSKALSIENGFTGRVMWSTDENGYTVTVLGEPARAGLDRDALFDEATASIDDAAVVGAAQVRGTATQIVRVQPTGGIPMDLYEDSNTGAYLRAVVDPGTSRAQTIEIEGYTTAAPGKKIIGSYDVDGKHYDVASVTPNATIADADLTPPKPYATWTFSHDPIPLDIYNYSPVSHEVRVLATVNGSTGTFLLDTGVQHIVLFEPFAAKAGLVNLGTSDFSDLLGNRFFEGYARASTLSVGGNTLHNVIVERVGDPNARIAGLLGYDFFAGAVADVRQSRGQMQLFDPTTFSTDLAAGAFAFPVDLTSRMPAVAITLKNGTVAYPRLDTASSYFMMLSESLRQQGKIDAADLTVQSNNASIGSTGPLGTMTESAPVDAQILALSGAQGTGRCVVMHELYVGPYKYQNPPLCFVGNNFFNDDGGLIGLDFLNHFDWIMDYPHAHVILTPNG